MISFLVTLLIFVLIAAVVLWLVRAILGAIPVPEPFARIAFGVVALILLLVFLSEVGWLGSPRGWRGW